MLKNNTPIKLMTYNIHSGKNIKGERTFHKILDYIKKYSPDILAIQEINQNKTRGYQVSLLSKCFNNIFHFGPHVKLDRGNYGIATFSSYSIIRKEHILLPSLKEQRGLIKTSIKIRDKNIKIFNTHLGLSNVERKKQFNIIQREIKRTSEPYIIMGDFNTTKIRLENLLYNDIGQYKDKHNLPTLIASRKRIDYILTSKDIKIVDYNVTSIDYSDHYPVISEIII